MKHLLSEAAEWRLLGMMFEYPSDAWRQQMGALVPDLPEPLQDLARQAIEHSTEGMHFALFGPGGKAPLREVRYLGGVQFGYLMSELSAFYDAFGYKPHLEEVEDHLAVEAGFVAYLKLKQAYAMANGDAEHAAVTAEAASNFCREHLATMVEPVVASLEVFAPDFLIAAGRILLGHVGPAPRHAYPLGGPIEDMEESSEMACGTGAEAAPLVQLGR